MAENQARWRREWLSARSARNQVQRQDPRRSWDIARRAGARPHSARPQPAWASRRVSDAAADAHPAIVRVRRVDRRAKSARWSARIITGTHTSGRKLNRRAPMNPLRGDADDGEVVDFDLDGLAGDVRIAHGSAAARSCSSAHTPAFSPGSRSSSGKKSTAENRVHAQSGKIVAGDDLAPDQLRLFAAGHAEGNRRKSHHV